MDIPCDIRRIRETDVPYIRATWIRSYARSWVGRNSPRGVSPSIYNTEHPGLVMNLLIEGFTNIAVNPEDDDHVFGYINFTVDAKPTIHYVYVKGSFRGCGIAKKLLASMISEVGFIPMWASHWVPAVAAMVPDGLSVDFNPYRGFAYALHPRNSGAQHNNSLPRARPQECVHDH